MASSPIDRRWEIPAYRVDELRPKRCRYCVCVFVLNEGERIQAQLHRMACLSDRVDIIIADGGSTDGSVDRDHIGPLGVNTLLVKTGDGKLSAQMRMAFAYGLRRGYDGIICIDGNNKDDPNAIPALADALSRGYDHLQGSRFIPGGSFRRIRPS